MYVLVTGGNGGLGTAVCKALAGRGDTVFVCDRLLPNTPDERMICIETDLTDQKSIDHCKSEIKKCFDHIDAIINLAGIFHLDSMVEGDEDDLRKIFEVNFWGTYRVCKTFLPMLSPGGKIIVMSSELAALSPPPFMGYYSIPKHAVDVYADVLRRECNYLGLKVVKIRAGSFKTSMLGGAASDYDKLLASTKYFQRPLIVLKKLMTDELQKTNDPKLFANLVLKILDAGHPKTVYRIKNSVKLKLLNFLPTGIQDHIYLDVTK